MPVTESRKKLFAWTDLLTMVVVDGSIAPLSRMRTMWVAAPAMVQAGVTAAFGNADVLTYSAVAGVAAERGMVKLWLPAVALATISLLKKTRSFDKFIEKPMSMVQKALQPGEADTKILAFGKKVLSPTLGAAIQMLVEYPFQVVMYRMATDTTSSTIIEAFVRSTGMSEGAGFAGLQTLYLGYDVTLYGVIIGAVSIALGEASGIRALGIPTQAIAGISSLATDGLALRMICSQTWSPLVAMRQANQVEGWFWIVRGLPLLVSENIAPIFLNGIRGQIVNNIFADVVAEAATSQQEQMEQMMAQFKAMDAANQTAQQKQSAVEVADDNDSAKDKTV